LLSIGSQEVTGLRHCRHSFRLLLKSAKLAGLRLGPGHFVLASADPALVSPVNGPHRLFMHQAAPDIAQPLPHENGLLLIRMHIYGKGDKHPILDGFSPAPPGP
jgi:hypothetical protein